MNRDVLLHLSASQPSWATGETASASLTLAPSHNHFHGVNGALNGMERR